MSEHTPTPWKVSKTHRYRVVAGKPNVDGGTVASCASYDNASSAEANAAFIVRACNSHEALVASLEDVLGSLREYHAMSTPPVRGRLGREIREAEAALKLAKP